MSAAAAVLIGYAADRAWGDPQRGHPVAVFGSAAAWWERVIWRDSRAAGVAYVAAAVGAPAAATWLVRRCLGPHGRNLWLAATLWAAIGGRSLDQVASSIGRWIEAGNLDEARRGLPSLVGRDPSELDLGQLCRAVVESVAENSSDAVVGPLLYGALAGPAGVVAYRCANTLDAMVGHHSKRYERFGWAAARLDDVLSWVPARVAALLTVACASIVGGSPARALEVLQRDGANHPSPNAGRVEAAFAGALDVGLGGENRYGDRVEVRGPLGVGPCPGPRDVERAVRLLRTVAGTSALLAALLTGAIYGSRR